jgi:6-pyruvoyltetrahydropterin/6-carboxytetrahydropterin synthase
MDEWIIYKEVRFEAAHKLPNHDGKCARLHGHSWVARIYVFSNELIKKGAKQGMVMDYGDIKSYLQPLLDQYLDHYYLNQSLGLENPTCEEVAKWLFERLEDAKMPGLYAVEIQETCTSGAKYRKF